MKDLDGKVAVVTGGAGGIGHALATRFAEAGMKLVLADVDATALDRAVAGFTDAGVETIGVPTDVGDRDAVFALAARTVEAFGTAHVVCNNAGVGGGLGPSWEITDAAWAWTLAVNFQSVVYGIEAFVPLLLEQDDGHIVNTASLAGLTALPFMAPYTATKHAVVGLSESLFHELAAKTPHVGVTVLCPAFLRTGLADSARHFAGQPDNAVVDDPGAQFMMGVVSNAVAGGGDPLDFATQVVDAVRTGRFMVVTNENEADAVVRQRGRETAGAPPELPRIT